jgi:integrase
MARIYQRNDSWYLDHFKDGKRTRRSLGKISEAEAQVQLAALERRLDAPPPAAGPDFLTWAEEYSHWHASEYPDSYYRVEQIIRCHLLPAFGDLAIGMINPRVVEAYKHARLETATPGTVVKEIRTLQAMINHAVTWDVIPRNPIKRVKAPKDLRSKPPRWYTKDELQQIYKASEYGPAWQLMANTGLRRTEAMQLEWKDIDRQGIKILSDAEARTKSGKWRLIPLSKGARSALKAFKGKGRVLPQVAPYSFSRAFSRDVTRSGLDGSLHCLRHTYCSHLVMAGVPLRTVQVLAGHASFTTTERYVHLAPDHLKGAVVSL